MRERGRAVAAVAGLLVLVLVSVIFLTSRPRDGVSWLEAAFRDGLTPLFVAASRVSQSVSGLWNGAVALLQAHEENERLRQEVQTLRRELARLEEFERQNAALRRGAGFARQHTPTGCLRGSDRPASQQLVGRFDHQQGTAPRRGAADGRRVACGRGGSRRAASGFSAEVILLIDPRSAVGGIVQRTGEPVLVEGLGFPGTRLRLRPLSASVDIRQGDVIVTSGLSSLFPKGIPIGVVEEVSIGPFGLSVDVGVRPHVDFATLEVVAVLARSAPDADAAAAGEGGRP